jgi:hypothetical protein
VVAEHKRVIAGELERHPGALAAVGAEHGHRRGSRSITRGLPLLVPPSAMLAPSPLTRTTPADRRTLTVPASRSWRRLRLVPWDVVIPEPERDLTLGDQLALEAGAVLAWLVAGYLDWHGHGLTDPEQVTKATAAYKAESDALGRFIGQRCLTGPHFHVRSAELFAAWAEWCRAEGEDLGTQTAFSLALTNRGFDKRPTKAANVWTGLRLANE